MHRWKIRTYEATLWLAVLFLSLEEARAKVLLPGNQDKDNPGSQTTWCKDTNACFECAETKRPRCLGRGEPLLGADLCGCCFSCVAIRDLGESCGSQLSIRRDVTGSGPASSSVGILATTWCREGLACVNFACIDSGEAGLLQAKKDQDGFGQDIIPLDAEAAFPIAELYQPTTTPLWKPILVNHDDPNLQKTVSSTPITPIPSSASSSTESRTRPQPCYAERQRTITISSYPSDDLLGRVVTANLEDRRFQLVYTGNLISELKVLLNAVDKFHGDSVLSEETVDSLLNDYLGSVFLHDDDGLRSGDDDHAEVRTSSVSDSQGTATPSNPHNSAFPGSRKRRELERMQEDLARFDPPGNVQEILIRGASAHREYFGGGQGHGQNTDILKKNASVMSTEASSQEDESTVRVHITNRPRKMQTLVDLEEDEEEEEEEGKREEEIEDEDRCNLQLANKGNAKGAGKLSPLTDEQSGVSPAVSRPLGTTEQNTVTKKTGKSGPVDVPQVVDTLWNETLTAFDDRLTVVEVRINVFERVLEEMAKWCNLGVLSMTRDCLVPQNSDIRYGRRGPNADEHLALPSGIEAVKIRGNRRKLRYNTPQRHGYRDTKIPDVAELPEIIAARRTDHRGRGQPVDRNSFRSIIDNGSPGRSPTGEYGGPRRPAKSRCGNSGNRGSSWRQPIADVLRYPSTHRTVRRSVSTANPFSSNAFGFKRPSNLERTAPRDHPDTRSSPILQETQIPGPGTSAKEVKKRELSSLEDIFPQEWASTAEISSSSGMPSWDMFVSGEKKGPELDVDRNVWSGASIPENGEHRRVAGSLVVEGTGEFRDSPEPLLFGNSDHTQATGSAGTVISKDSQDVRKVPDPRAAPYSITNRGNSTIRIEEISGTEYGDGWPKTGGSSAAEDDFDHIYEGVEAGSEDGDFEYNVAYDRIQYVDGSSVEIVTDVPPRPEEQGTELKGVLDLSRGGIRSVLFPRKRNRRASVKGDDDDQCESGRRTKREMPLLSFGSTEKHEPKTIVWPPKWVGYRSDGLQRAGGSGKHRTALDSGSRATGSRETTTTPSLPPQTTEHRRGKGETNDVVTPKISGVDHRARKNRRKLLRR